MFFFWVIPRRLNFICRRFGTLCLFHLHRRVGTYPSMKMEQVECSETSAYKIQPPWNYAEESIQHSEQGESLKSRKYKVVYDCINPLKPELNSICYLLALLAHHFLHVSRIRVKSLTFRRLMSYIYIYIWSTHS